MSAAIGLSPSEEIRSKLNHPVLDCDGHYIEFMPYYMDFVEEVGGLSMVETFRQNRIGEIRLNPSAWHNMSREQRQHRPHGVQPAQPLTPCGAGASGACLGVHGDGKAHRAEVKKDAMKQIFTFDAWEAGRLLSYLFIHFGGLTSTPDSQRLGRLPCSKSLHLRLGRHVS